MKTKIEKVTCDICGKDIDGDWAECGDEFRYAILDFRFTIWYGGNFVIHDVCKPCNVKLMTLLFNNNLLDKAAKKT